MKNYLVSGSLLLFVSCSPAINNSISTPEHDEYITASAVQQGELYFDPSVFKDTVGILKVEAPYDTVKGLANVPSDKISFTKEVRIDSFWVKKYSEVLYRAQEPILYKGNGNLKVYRFTWLRSFDNPVILKLYEESGQVLLETKWLHADGAVSKSTVKRLSGKRMAEFEKLLTSGSFWNSPAVLSVGPVVDGSRWLLEARDRMSYHFMSRYSPNSDKPQVIRSAGEWLIANSDASGEKIY